MHSPPVRQFRCAGRLFDMNKKNRITEVVTIIMVVEAVISIIYLTRELLR